MIEEKTKALTNLRHEDPEIASLIDEELDRQRNTLEMIASENFTSEAVMEAQGTWLTNKYAEGLPGKRYYGGCEVVDQIETLAIERAKTVFNAKFANVQPHSGAQANMAVFLAFLKPGDTILGLDLSHGGHLTHGSPVNCSGLYYNAISYKVDKETGLLDYDALEALAEQEKPRMIIGGASAYPRVIDFKRMAAIAKKVDALFMVDMAHIAGLVATGEHPSPVPHADFVTTTTHKSLKGPRGGLILTNNEDHAKKINKAVFPGSQGGPLVHVIAAKAAILKEAQGDDYKAYQTQVVKNARALAARLIEHGFKVLTNGTDNHLVLVDLRNRGLTGKEGDARLESVGVTVNKNTVPFDTESPFVTSGIRIGAPALTSRGFLESDFEVIGDIIHDTLSDDYETHLEKNRHKVSELCQKYPLYPNL